MYKYNYVSLIIKSYHHNYHPQLYNNVLILVLQLSLSLIHKSNKQISFGLS